MKKILLIAVMMVSVTSVFAQFFNPFFNPMACGVVYPSTICLPPPPPVPVIHYSSIEEIHERALKEASFQVAKEERDFRASYKKSHPNATEAEINSALGNHFENLNKAGQNAQMCTTSSSSYNSSSSNSSTSSMNNSSSKAEDCPLCYGSGKCQYCNNGIKTVLGIGGGTRKCENCNGTGRCSGCNGSGKKSW